MVTLSGIVKEVNPMHRSKDSLPIIVIELGISIDVIYVQYKKALSPIVVTPSLITTLHI